MYNAIYYTSSYYARNVSLEAFCEIYVYLHKEI